jgi:hypothetical protein
MNRKKRSLLNISKLSKLVVSVLDTHFRISLKSNESILPFSFLTKRSSFFILLKDHIFKLTVLHRDNR